MCCMVLATKLRMEKGAISLAISDARNLHSQIYNTLATAVIGSSCTIELVG